MAEKPLKIDYEIIPKELVPLIINLENLFKAADEFVRVHYACTDARDRSIKTLATMNQLIELKKQKGQ